MTTEMISIEVDAETAQEFASADVERRRKLRMLLGLELRAMLKRPQRKLLEIMDEMGAYAESQGLTPEILESLLKNDDDE